MIPAERPSLRQHFQAHWAGLLVAAVVLVIYGALAVLRHSETLIWDEGRYVKYAIRLWHGYYVEPGNPDFVNGPGYPIVLMPFVKWVLGARLLNALLMAGAAWFTWLTVRRYAGNGWAFAAAAFTGLHPSLVWMGFSVMTEPLAMFCFTGFMWSYCLALSRLDERRWLWLAIAFFGWLTLTRVFFGHVLMATSVACIALMILPAWRPMLRRTLLIMAGAFVMCVPYLFHTWQKTGEVLCWSTNSGELLYWMTSHHEGENGHWFSTQDVEGVPELADKHAKLFEHALSLPVLEREAEFKALARESFREDPKAFGYNWLCNLTRLAFGFPRSHHPEELRTVVLIFTNGPLIMAALLALVLAVWNWRLIPAEILILQIAVAFYLGGSSLAPALPRYFVLCVPILFLGIATTLSRTVSVRLKA